MELEVQDMLNVFAFTKSIQIPFVLYIMFLLGHVNKDSRFQMNDNPVSVLFIIRMSQAGVCRCFFQIRSY